MPYFVISNSDGETSVEEVTKEELLSRIQPEDGTDFYGGRGFISDLNETDTNYWGDNIMIIKGSLVVPKPKEVVKEYEL